VSHTSCFDEKDWLLYCYFNRLYYEIIIITTQKQSKWITCNVDTNEKHWYNMPLQKKYHWSSLIIPPYYLACARFVVEGKQQVSSLLRFRLSSLSSPFFGTHTFTSKCINWKGTLCFSVIIFWSHNRARKNLSRLQEDKNVWYKPYSFSICNCKIALAIPLQS